MGWRSLELIREEETEETKEARVKRRDRKDRRDPAGWKGMITSDCLSI